MLEADLQSRAEFNLDALQRQSRLHLSAGGMSGSAYGVTPALKPKGASASEIA